MGLFDRLRDAAAPDPGELPEAERPYSHRPSPQGWTDRVAEWPRDKLARFEVLFPYPADAVRQLAEHLDGDLDGLPREERDSRLQGAFVALQALRLPRQAIPDYKGTYGALLAWGADAPGLEELLEHPIPGALARDIAVEVRSCEDPDLAAVGEGFLRRVLATTAPGAEPGDLEEQAERAKDVQEMMFRRVQSLGYRDPPPEERFVVSGLAGPTRPARPVDPSEVISLDEPVDRVPEPEEPGPGERAAAAQRAILGRMREEAGGGGVGVAEADAFPRGVGEEAGGRAMTAEVVFRTLLEECLKDGKLTPMEMRALTNLRAQLGMDLAGHEQMLRKVQAQLERTAPAETADMDPLVLFERLCWQALDDERVDAAEREVLGVVARYLHITQEEYDAIRRRIAQSRGA